MAASAGVGGDSNSDDDSSRSAAILARLAYCARPLRLCCEAARPRPRAARGLPSSSSSDSVLPCYLVLAQWRDSACWACAHRSPSARAAMSRSCSSICARLPLRAAEFERDLERAQRWCRQGRAAQSVQASCIVCSVEPWAPARARCSARSRRAPPAAALARAVLLELAFEFATRRSRRRETLQLVPSLLRFSTRPARSSRSQPSTPRTTCRGSAPCARTLPPLPSRRSPALAIPVLERHSARLLFRIEEA